MKRLCMLFILVSTLQASDLKTTLLWEYNAATPGARESIHGATAVGNSVVVARAVEPGSNATVEVVAYDRTTGTFQWQDTLPTPGTPGFAVTMGQSVYVAVNSPVSPYGIMVRAYSSTGDALWTSTVLSNWGPLQDLAAANGRVIVVGGKGNGYIQGLISVLDAATGAKVWETIIDNAPNDTVVWKVDASTNTVVTASQTIPYSTAPRQLFLEARSAATGALIWSVPGSTVNPTAVAVQGSRVFLTGSNNSTTILAAFDSASGTLLWQAPSVPGAFYSLATNMRQIVAAGYAGTGGVLIESHDPATGALKWSDSTTPQPGFGEYFAGIAMTATGVYAVGAAGQEFTYSEAMLRAYNASGTLLADDRSHRAPFPYSSGFYTVAVDGQTIAAAGVAGDQKTSAAMIRVYDVSTTMSRR